MIVHLENATMQRFNSISWHDSKLVGAVLLQGRRREERLPREPSGWREMPLGRLSTDCCRSWLDRSR